MSRNREERPLPQGHQAEQGEVFLDVIGYEGLYSVSSRGQIVSHKGNAKFLRQQTCARRGYKSVSLRLNGKNTCYQVHKIVLETFRGPPPDTSASLLKEPYKNHPSKYVCLHLDGAAGNNNIDNLRWNTHSEACKQRWSRNEAKLQEIMEDSTSFPRARDASGRSQDTSIEVRGQ